MPALFFAGILMAATLGNDMLDHTIENSRRLTSEFEAAAGFVDAFRAQHSRLPTSDEMEWQTGLSSPFIVDPDVGQFGREGVAALGRPPEGAYILAQWRGQWMEYFASWSRQTSMPLDKNAYYLFGSRPGDCLIGALGLFLCLTGSARLWGRTRRRQG